MICIQARRNNCPMAGGNASSLSRIVMGATGAARLWPNAVGRAHASVSRPQGDAARRGLRARAGPGESLKAQVLSRKSITEWGRRWRSLESSSASGGVGAATTLPAPHLPGPHPALSDPGLVAELPGACQILAPLCGASADLSLLLHMGFKVIGVEAIREAIDAFRSRFPELQVPEEAQAGVHDGFERFLSVDLMLYHGDFLDVSPVVLSLAGTVDCVWDRAAFDTLPEELRRNYVQVLRSILPKGGKVLLVLRKDALATSSGGTSSDDAREIVEELFSEWCEIRDLSESCLGCPTEENWFACTKQGHF